MTSQALRSAALDDIPPRTLYDMMRLRVEVFVDEQNCRNELDGRDTDPATTHVWAEDDRGVPAYLRILEDGAAARIGRVCTRADARGQGLAAALMRHALELTGDRPVVLGAQSHLVGWYARFGFRPAGEQYLEDGIPHTPMERPG